MAQPSKNAFTTSNFQIFLRTDGTLGETRKKKNLNMKRASNPFSRVNQKKLIKSIQVTKVRFVDFVVRKIFKNLSYGFQIFAYDLRGIIIIIDYVKNEKIKSAIPHITGARNAYDLCAR